MRSKRDEENFDEYKLRLEKSAAGMQRLRDSRTAEQKDAKKIQNRDRMRVKRAADKAAELANNTENPGVAEFQRIQTVPRSLTFGPQVFKGGLPRRNDGTPSSGSGLNEDDMRTVQNVLHKVNPFVHSYKAVSQLDPKTIADKRLVFRRDKKPARAHNRKYNLPEATNEIAIITKDIKLEPSDVIVHKQGGGIWRISEFNRCYDPLHYVLLFPYGEDGWNGDIRVGNKRISPIQFYCYRTQIRENDFNSVLRGAKLSQQYFCDMFHMAEKWKLNWVKNNQTQIKAEKYNGLYDAIANDEDVKRKGIRIVCPPSIIGGQRWYIEHFQDAIAVVRNKGKVRKLQQNIIIHTQLF